MTDETKQVPTEPSVGPAAVGAAEQAAEAAKIGEKTSPAAAAAPKPTAAAGRAAAPRPAPAPPTTAIAGKTTTSAAEVGKPAAAAAKRAPDDTSPLMGRRGWIGLAWGAFTAASAAALAATGRFMFPNVLNEPPQQFKAGFPDEYVSGVDERWKDKFGIWLVRTNDDVVHHAGGFYALISTCTHLGCTPNWLAAEGKFKCPCHGSGFRPTGINFEGPAPRPLERARVVLADDGQILVDKARKFQYEMGQWTDPESFLKA